MSIFATVSRRNRAGYKPPWEDIIPCPFAKFLGRTPVEVAILTRRVTGAPPDLLRRLAEAGVRPAATAGFLTVLGDTLAGCVDPASLGALDRVLVVIENEKPSVK